MLYDVRALDRSNASKTLRLSADNADDAMTAARAQGLIVLGTSRVSLPSLISARLSRSGSGLPLGQFSLELVTLLEAGLSVVESLETLSERQTRPERRQLLADLVGRLYRGLPLSDAMELSTEAFPALYVALVRSSERSGNLAQSIRRYAVYQAQLEIVRKKIIGALIYPSLLATVGFAVVTFLLGYVVPRFAVIFSDLGRDLPTMSRWLLGWGALVADHAVALLVLVMLAAVVVASWLMVPSNRTKVLNAALRLPGLGERFKIYQLARYYRSLGLLLNGGIPIIAALQMTHGLLMGELRNRLDDATRAIREGVSISEAMVRFELTTSVSARMLKVGERSGQIGNMMERIAQFHDDEVQQWIDWFLRLFEPLLMLFIGVAVGAIVVLMYLPIFELAGSL